MWIPLGLLVGFVALLIGVSVLHSRRRLVLLEEIGKQTLSNARRHAILANVSLLKKLSAEDMKLLEQKLQIFAAEKSWEACGGLLEVNQEMRDAISAQACLLVLKNDQPLYPDLKSILVYPSAYRTRSRDQDPSVRLGESWQSGSVVLSWESVQSGGRDRNDASNLVIHEFAHQLDQLNGRADGVPVLDSRDEYAEWSGAFRKAYIDFCDRINTGEKVEIDTYGATNEAEFFAVGSETFFERPDRLRESYPVVYELMKEYYNLDPSEWR